MDLIERAVRRVRGLNFLSHEDVRDGREGGLMNVLHAVITFFLIQRDQREGQILNRAWHEGMLKQKGAGSCVEKGRRASRRVVDRRRKGYQSRSGAAAGAGARK